VDTILLLFLRRSIYPGHSGDPSPLVFIQHPMVSHVKRSSTVEFLQGDPEDREKVLVPHVDVYCYYCWDGYCFNFTCTIRMASEWVGMGCDFSLVAIGFMSYLVPDCVEPVAYGFLVLMTLLDLI